MPFTNGITPANLPTSAVAGMNTGSVGGGVAHATVVENIYSVYDPFSIERLAFSRHGKRPGFRSLMDILGPDYNKGKKAPTTGHYERNNWVGQLVNVSSIVTPAGGAGLPIIIAVGTSNMTTTGVEVSGAARKGSNIRVRDLILLPGGILAQVTAKNTSTDPHRLTLTPMDSAIDLDDLVEADVSYAVVTNAHAPGSILPEGLLPKTMKYTNEFQIVKEAVAISGTELTNAPFVQIEPLTESSVLAVMNQDAMNRFEHACSGALLWGNVNNNIVDSNTQIGYDVNVSWTEGFMQFRSANSYENEYDPANFTTDEFDEIAATLERENVGTRSILSLQGNQYLYLVEALLGDKYDQSLTMTLLKDSADGYGLSMDKWQPIMEDQDWVAWLGFQGLRKSGFTFHFRIMHEFVAPDAAGADAYDYPYDAIYLPLTRVTDRTSGEQRTSIGYEWKELPPYSRKMVYGTIDGAGVAGIGGASATPVSEYDWRRAFMLSELAFHGACPNKIVYHTQQAA